MAQTKMMSFAEIVQGKNVSVRVTDDNLVDIVEVIMAMNGYTRCYSSQVFFPILHYVVLVFSPILHYAVLVFFPILHYAVLVFFPNIALCNIDLSFNIFILTSFDALIR